MTEPTASTPQASELALPYDTLIEQLDALIKEKEDNEARWSKLNSGLIVAVSVSLTVGAVVSSLWSSQRLIPAGFATATGIVASASNVIPYERKRIGNKVLLAKARDIRERVQDLKEGICLSEAPFQERYALFAQLRMEKNVLAATSALTVTLRPFREVLEEAKASAE